MRNTIILAALAASISLPASAAVTLKVGSPACVTEEHFLQLAQAVVAKDMDAIQYLSEHACTISGKPTRVTVLDIDPSGTVAHVRAYRGKANVELWTVADDLEGYKPTP